MKSLAPKTLSFTIIQESMTSEVTNKAKARTWGQLNIEHTFMSLVSAPNPVYKTATSIGSDRGVPECGSGPLGPRTPILNRFAA